MAKAALRGERPTWLDPVEFPFDCKYVEIGGHRLHYVDEGKGPILLFVAGGLAWSFVFRHVIKELRGEFRCIALDPPAAGLSTPAPGFVNTIEGNGRAVAAFIERLDLRDITMVLHDLGAAIGTTAAGIVPDRIRGFVFTATFAFPLSDFGRVPQILHFVSGRFVGGFLNARFRLIPRAIVRLNGARALRTPAKRAGWLGQARDKAARNRWRPLFRDAAKAHEHMARVEASLETTFSGRPVLLIYGEKDFARKAGFQARFEKIFPGARSLVMPGAGHFPHEDDPVFVVREIRSWFDAGPQRLES